MEKMDFTVLNHLKITGRGTLFYVRYDWRKIKLQLGMKIVNERGEVGRVRGVGTKCGDPANIVEGEDDILVDTISQAKGFNIVVDDAD